MSAARIRPGLASDSRAIAETHVACWRESYVGIVPDELLAKISVDERAVAWAERGEGLGTGWGLFVAEDAGRVVGFAYGGRTEIRDGEDPALFERLKADYPIELGALYLRRSHHGRGLGRELFEAVRSAVLAKGQPSLLAWTFRDNPVARRFYERQGGRLVAEGTFRFGAPLANVAYGFEMP